MSKILKRFPLLIIAIVVLASNTAVLIDSYSMKWDLSEQYLPWRHFLSRSILSAEIPFWNPFQLGGYPTYLDPQSGFWYYPAWVISLAGPYTMQLIEWEYCSLLILAGWGFFKLCQHLKFSTFAGTATGIAYALSGFMIGNAQHLTWIIAAAYLPWVVYSYLKWRENPTWFTTMLFTLIFYCFATGSYPAFTLTIAYLLLTNFLIFLYKTNNKKTFIRWAIILFGCLLISFAPIIFAFVTESMSFSRGAGVSLQKALQHPFSLGSLISMLFPFASLKNEMLFQTDLSMRNAYMGIFIFPVLIIWFTQKKKKEGIKLATLAIAFLLISLGEQLPIRTFLYNYIPGFNLFRFPALFRLFTIFFTLLLCAHIIENLQQPLNKLSKRALIFTVTLFFATYSIVIYKYAWHWFPIFDLVALSTAIENSNFESLLSFQFAFQCLVFCCLTLALLKQKQNIFIIILAFDLMLATRLNQMGTVVYPIKTRQVDQMIDSAKGPYAHPKLQAQNQTIDQAYTNRWPLNWNLNNYYGQIAIDGYNPFVLNTFNALSDSTIRDSVWQYPWYHLATNTKESTEAIAHEPSPMRAIQQQGFRPSSFSWAIEPGTNTTLVVAQNPYKHWRAWVNEQEIQPGSIHEAQQIIEIRDTKAVVVKMEFFPKLIAALMLMQVTFLIAIISFLIISYLKKLYLYRKSTLQSS